MDKVILLDSGFTEKKLLETFRILDKGDLILLVHPNNSECECCAWSCKQCNTESTAGYECRNFKSRIYETGDIAVVYCSAADKAPDPIDNTPMKKSKHYCKHCSNQGIITKNGKIKPCHHCS